MKFAIIILISLLLCSCYDSHEPNDLAYATAVGIDEGTNGNYNITIQFAKPHNISGGEQGGSGEDIIGNITVEAPNIYAGIGLGNHILSKSLDMSHLQLFLFSQSVAEKGIKNFIETISRSKEIRPNVYTAVCTGEARDFLNNASPVVDINPSKYYQLIFGKSDFRSIPESYSQDLYFYMNLPERNSVIPLAGIPQEEGKESESQNPTHENAPVNQDQYEFGLRDYTAGEIAVYSDQKGEVTGSAVFKGDKMVGTMNISETQIYNYLTGNSSKNYVSFKTDKSDSPITVLVGIEKKPHIKYIKKEHKSYISLSLTADFVALPDDYLAERDLEHFEQQAEKAITAQISELINKTRNEFNSDIIGFGEKAKSKFKTAEEFEKYGWDILYKNMEYEIETELNVRRTGLTLRTNKNIR